MSDNFFRSAHMTYVQVLLPAAIADEFVHRIGREGIIEFTDLNAHIQPFNRKHTNDIIRCQELEKQIRSIQDILDEYDAKYDDEMEEWHVTDAQRPSEPGHLDRLADQINTAYKSLREQAAAEKTLAEEYHTVVDQQMVLGLRETLLARESREDVRQLESGGGIPSDPSERQPLTVSDRDGGVSFSYIAGVIKAPQRVSFERQVFLTSRGNSHIQFDDTNVERTGKLPFVMIFLGDRLKRSLERLCHFMNVKIAYASYWEQNPDDLLRQAQEKRTDFQRIHNATLGQLSARIEEVSQHIQEWRVSVFQEKAILITLNKFVTQQTVLLAEGWLPSDRYGDAQAMLDDITRGKGLVKPVLSETPTNQKPPTYFELNEFTAQFQQIVDTYGIPRYQEFNPTVPTIITFPFLFGMMYGDIFHGSCVCLVGLLLVLFQDRLQGQKLGEMLGGLFGARYILLFMGMFAIFCGLIYNDCMSIMIDGWNGKQWGIYTNAAGKKFVGKTTSVYMFGIDPSWHGATNELTFANSLKMKLSVTVGVTQMTFGLFLKLANHLHEGDYVSVFFEFVPQLIFMLVFFGYMIGMIFYKWTVNWQQTKSVPPSLISTLIQMILSVGKLNGVQPLYNSALQQSIQSIFVLLMVVAIPWMLFPKPLILNYRHQNSVENGGYAQIDDEPPGRPSLSQILKGDRNAVRMQLLGRHAEAKEEVELAHKYDSGAISSSPKSVHGGHDEEEFSFSEVFIHQMIHTIEYVLGTVSNTASYLRLWALSLAHAQLSQVFFQKTIKAYIGSVPGLIIGVFMFFMFTFAVLLVMDVLECFLHALRLHWVEFQNKFYYADGIAFEPFSYSNALAAERL